MPDLLATFLISLAGGFAAGLIVAYIDDIAWGVADGWRFLRRGLRDLFRAMAQLLNPTIVLPHWLRRLIERIRR